jgi:hypothetical protein
MNAEAGDEKKEQGDDVGRVDAKETTNKEGFEFALLGFHMTEVDAESADDKKDGDSDPALRKGNQGDFGHRRHGHRFSEVGIASDEKTGGRSKTVKAEDQENGRSAEMV